MTPVSYNDVAEWAATNGVEFPTPDDTMPDFGASEMDQQQQEQVDMQQGEGEEQQLLLADQQDQQQQQEGMMMMEGQQQQQYLLQPAQLLGPDSEPMSPVDENGNPIEVFYGAPTARSSM
jgi:hypothetical protein